MNNETLKFIHKNKLVAIARDIDPKDIVDAAQGLYDGNIRMMEITYNQKSERCIEDTTESIRLVREKFNCRMVIGVGTVLTPLQLMKAYEAGAAFILSPNVDETVIKLTKQLGLVSIPGALTPTEIITAYQYGADFVKVFPAGSLGVDYVKNVMGPINHIPLMLVGGIDEQNMKDYLKVGISLFGLGSNILKSDYIKNRNFSAITELAKKYVDMIRDCEK